jgi:hypothetical protein
MPAIGSRFDPDQEEPIEIAYLILVSRMHARERVFSWLCLHGLSVGVQLAHQGVSVLFCGRSETGNEEPDQFPAGAAQVFRAREIGVASRDSDRDCVNRFPHEVVLVALFVWLFSTSLVTSCCGLQSRPVFPESPSAVRTTPPRCPACRSLISLCPCGCEQFAESATHIRSHAGSISGCC